MTVIAYSRPIVHPIAVTLAIREVHRLILEHGSDPAIYDQTTIRYWLAQGHTPAWIAREILGFAGRGDGL